jgi:hypothetical protein
MRNSSVLKRPLLRSGRVRSGGYSFLCSGAGGGDGGRGFFGEDEGDTTGDLRRRSPEGELARRPEKAGAPAARRSRAAPTAPAAAPDAARCSGVAPLGGDARDASDGAADRTYGSTAVLPYSAATIAGVRSSRRSPPAAEGPYQWHAAPTDAPSPSSTARRNAARSSAAASSSRRDADDKSLAGAAATGGGIDGLRGPEHMAKQAAEEEEEEEEESLFSLVLVSVSEDHAVGNPEV